MIPARTHKKRSAEDDRLPFRQWLVHQVLALRWTAPPSATLEQIAEHLGVTVSVLEEARVLRDQQAIRRGRVVRPGRKRGVFRVDYARLALGVPPEIYRAWNDALNVLQIRSSALLRSLLHHFLLSGAPRPTSLKKAWYYRGQIYQLKKHKNIQLETRVTLGAQTALDHHAAEWGVHGMAILRGIVTDMLEGHVKRLRIVAYSELWGDPDRYLHPEKFV